MSKKIALFCALVGVLAFVAGPAFAEVQNIKVSGDITAMGVYRDNYDLEDDWYDDDTALRPITALDEDSLFMSIVKLRVDADLTDNVAATIALANLREWDAAATSVDDIAVDLANITLKEMLYSPLTVIIGRQNLNYGNGVIVGYGLFQDPNAIKYDDLSTLHGYDAVRAILDYDPWTLDLVLSKIEEADDAAASVKDDDTDLYGANLGYQFDSYDAEAEAYLWYKQDSTYNLVKYDVADNASGTFDKNEVYTAGGRLSLVPIENLTLGGELAFQWGEIQEKQDTTPTADDELTRDREAMLGYASAKYDFADVRFAPTLGVEYLFASGEEIDSAGEYTDTSDFDAWDPIYRGKVLGSIGDCLETLAGLGTNDPADTAGFTNRHSLKAMGSLDLGELVDGLSLDLAYVHYWFDEVPAYNESEDDIGGEVDLKLTYDYTEDVAFALNGAWFMPGDYYDTIHISRTLGAGGMNQNGAPTSRVANDTAVSVVGSCKVTF